MLYTIQNIDFYNNFYKRELLLNQINVEMKQKYAGIALHTFDN
jgi:hypothetical protein